MKPIYTGYFAKAKKYEEAGLQVISIARFKPNFFYGKECLDLAPSKELLMKYKNGTISWEQYRTEFFKDHPAENVAMAIKVLINELPFGKEGFILCCFEKPDAECHRHLVAEIANTRLGYDIQEYTGE